uniref:Uncharacterized protein n=1 Tax=Curvibacter symbiont subsp. Hydra magnipapillata TaxID=667019 RepID=C9Y8B5_CURXX|nr:hypothetical protein Csp_A03660 [Curvibacter putative symbiont of Hydra magnipapillata]
MQSPCFNADLQRLLSDAERSNHVDLHLSACCGFKFANAKYGIPKL